MELNLAVLIGLLTWPKGEGEMRCVYCRHGWAIPRFGGACAACEEGM